MDFCAKLDPLIALHPGDTEKITILNKAKDAFDFSIGYSPLEVSEICRRAMPITCSSWARILNEQHEVVKKTMAQIRTADVQLRLYRGLGAQSREAREALYDAELELTIAHDVIWRLSKKLRQEVLAVRSMATPNEKRMLEESLATVERDAVREATDLPQLTKN
jgi:hypothetical protein